MRAEDIPVHLWPSDDRQYVADMIDLMVSDRRRGLHRAAGARPLVGRLVRPEDVVRVFDDGEWWREANPSIGEAPSLLGVAQLLLGIPIVGDRAVPEGQVFVFSDAVPGGPRIVVQMVDPPTVPGEVWCGHTHLGLISGRCPKCGAAP